MPAGLHRRGAGAKLVGYITYTATWTGWVYLARVIDCYSKQVVGYAMAKHMRTSLVTDALDMCPWPDEITSSSTDASFTLNEGANTFPATLLFIFVSRGCGGRWAGQGCVGQCD